jgi:hypothetical protein
VDAPAEVTFLWSSYTRLNAINPKQIVHYLNYTTEPKAKHFRITEFIFILPLLNENVIILGGLGLGSSRFTKGMSTLKGIH